MAKAKMMFSRVELPAKTAQCQTFDIPPAQDGRWMPMSWEISRNHETGKDEAIILWG